MEKKGKSKKKVRKKNVDRISRGMIRPVPKATKDSTFAINAEKFLTGRIIWNSIGIRTYKPGKFIVIIAVKT